jgi:hypothetical protein
MSKKQLDSVTISLNKERSNRGPRQVGLRQMRKNTGDKSPQHHCDNCGCDRYSPCTCQRKVN